MTERADESLCNFDSDEHALRTGLMIGLLRCAGLEASMTVDTQGKFTPVIMIMTQDGKFEVEMRAES